MATCKRCNGSGSVDCPKCDGRGSSNHWDSGIRIPVVNDILSSFTDSKPCQKCNETGEVKCPNCNGTGKV